MQSKFIGTGHADTTKYEWLVNQHRDSLSSYIGQTSQLTYIALAENESVARSRFKLLEKMVMPCGVPPPPPAED